MSSDGGRPAPNAYVVHPAELRAAPTSAVTRFNTRLAVRITAVMGSMWSAYAFALLSLLSLPAILVAFSPGLRSWFPSWIVTTSMITLIAWISQNFLQLVLLPVIMVGQNVIQSQQDAKAEADHRTLTYLTNLQQEQLRLLAGQREVLERLDTEKRSARAEPSPDRGGGPG
ncbi:hypothetical protein [Microbacterium sp.]|uniref:hypothetical protein n=1 Tax=Microbacterium sp. TaxID=51671 RepID=UPI0025D89A6C|nr:hypothetical protein [Microbacterium sp.]